MHRKTLEIDIKYKQIKEGYCWTDEVRITKYNTLISGDLSPHYYTVKNRCKKNGPILTVTCCFSFKLAPLLPVNDFYLTAQFFTVTCTYYSKLCIITSNYP